MKQQKKTIWGLLSGDGYFQPISDLSIEALEYVSKTKEELEVLLEEKEQKEEYEECCLIRDELSKR